MKQLAFFFILLNGLCQVRAQTIDSLCQRLYSEHELLHMGPDVSIHQFHKCFSKDASRPLNIAYTYNNKELNGWYLFDYRRDDRRLSIDVSREMIGLVGVYPSVSSGMIGIEGSSTFFSVSLDACFLQGVPCCQWRYFYTWKTADSLKNTRIFKTEEFENGLLHGKFHVRVNYKTQDEMDNKFRVLYETQFIHGTGYYKDFYPDGTLRMEGALIEGKRDGDWKYYQYEEKINSKIIIEKYDIGKEILYKTFYSSDQMEKAILWERQPDKFKDVDPEDYDDPSVNPYFH